MTTDPLIAPDRLNGQVAIVTGGGRGLGQAFAQALAAAGVKVAITARTGAQLDETVRLIEHAGGVVMAFTTDVTDRPAMKQVLATVEQQFGPLDILVNNAAVITPLGYDWEIDPDEWWRTLEINLRGPFECTHMVLPGMMARRKGRIINVTSGAAYILDLIGNSV
ncbi:MAG: SDR family NAD(P)-dependent oxidoreductase [Chloroflexi bacterium]|nr:SDR family NAD(P)-dependent oxidoreductase [Chloroflexota bacterium]